MIQREGLLAALGLARLPPRGFSNALFSRVAGHFAGQAVRAARQLPHSDQKSDRPYVERGTRPAAKTNPIVPLVPVDASLFFPARFFRLLSAVAARRHSRSHLAFVRQSARARGREGEKTIFRRAVSSTRLREHDKEMSSRQ